MLRVFLLLVALLTISHGGSRKKTIRQSAGEDAEIENYPFQVAVLLDGLHICGGSILNSLVILTAAHCFDEQNIKENRYIIEYGSTDVHNGEVVQIHHVVRHEKFDSESSDYDIAIIYLENEMKFSSKAGPIELATALPPPGTKVAFTGWGVPFQNHARSDILQKIDVFIVSHSHCVKKYSRIGRLITDRMICAKIPGDGKDACKGDSGGPLIAHNKLIGIVSWGEDCGNPLYPGVYTNVVNLHSWIEPRIQ